MSSTPLAPGSAIIIEVEDPNDPNSPLTAYFDDAANPESDYTAIAGTVVDQNIDWFWWLVDSAAKFHNLPVYDSHNARGRVVDSLRGAPAGLDAPGAAPGHNPATAPDPSETLAAQEES
jgi:hypothetical protein